MHQWQRRIKDFHQLKSDFLYDLYETKYSSCYQCYLTIQQTSYCSVGNLGFDPLGLTPKSPAEFDLMRTKEVNNGRLAMIGIAGIVAQELVTSEKVFNF